MLLLLLIFPLLLFAQGPYNGLINYRGQILDCSFILNRYAHSGVPQIKEDRKVKICCASLREIYRMGTFNDLLIAHLRICRQLGR